MDIGEEDEIDDDLINKMYDNIVTDKDAPVSQTKRPKTSKKP